ncbi:MAG: hypothetical protein ACYCX3_05825 [Thermoleophilia bacterium]
MGGARGGGPHARGSLRQIAHQFRDTALRVLMEQRDQDRRELEERIHANFERLIQPALDRLGRALGVRPEASLVETLAVNLEEIVRPYAGGLLGPEAREPLSHSAVSFHRGNIRRKLGLAAGGPHLTTHLAAHATDASQ